MAASYNRRTIESCGVRTPLAGPARAARRSHCVVHAIPANICARCDVRRVGEAPANGDTSSEAPGQPEGTAVGDAAASDAAASDAPGHGEPAALLDGPGADWPDAPPAVTTSAKTAARGVVMAARGWCEEPT